MNLFHRTAYDTSKLITRAYSTSFMLGIRTLSKKFHDPVFGIYGMVRYADEIVDSFHDFDKKKLKKGTSPWFREQSLDHSFLGDCVQGLCNRFSLCYVFSLGFPFWMTACRIRVVGLVCVIGLVCYRFSLPKCFSCLTGHACSLLCPTREHILYKEHNLSRTHSI